LKVRDMCVSALMAAFLCVIGPVTIPTGTVPLSLTGFGICLAGGVLGVRRAGLAVLLYILIGISGLPVFSGWNGSFAHLAGPTGGFIIGYLPCAMISGMGKGAGKRRMALWMAVGTLSMYIMGAAWFAAVSESTILPALSVCVLPFLLPDAVKVFFAAHMAARVAAALKTADITK